MSYESTTIAKIINKLNNFISDTKINKIQFIRLENIKKLIDKRFDGIVENFAKKVKKK